MKLNFVLKLSLAFFALAIAACGGVQYEDIPTTDLPSLSVGTLPTQPVADNPEGVNPSVGPRVSVVAVGSKFIKGNQVAGLISIGAHPQVASGLRLSGEITIGKSF